MLPHHRHRPVGFAAWAVVALLLVGVPAACHHAIARPLFVASGDGLAITLHDDACPPELAAVATNLPRRAVWQRGAEAPVEGCWTLSRFGVVAIYFADRTVAVVPAGMFEKVEGT